MLYLESLCVWTIFRHLMTIIFWFSFFFLELLEVRCFSLFFFFFTFFDVHCFFFCLLLLPIFFRKLIFRIIVSVFFVKNTQHSYQKIMNTTSLILTNFWSKLVALVLAWLVNSLPAPSDQFGPELGQN